jgi:CRISPR/Cas system-associated exonuclease Cas4 (RecB family)
MTTTARQYTEAERRAIRAELRRKSKTRKRLEAELEEAREEVDQLIGEADDAGIPRQDIAADAKLSRPRFYGRLRQLGRENRNAPRAA